MNTAQIHLALNHAPLFLSLLGGGVLLLGMIKKNNSFRQLSLYLLVIAALLTAPVFLTGEGTEEIAEHLPGVNESMIERHEEMAKISLFIISATGAVALIGLVFRKNTSVTKLVFVTALVLSAASFGTMAQTAHLGGLIRHSELQNGASPGTNERDNDEDNKIQKEGEKTVKDSLKQVQRNQKEDNDD